VFGRPEAASARKLWICVSGDELTKADAHPILDLLGQGVIDFGTTVGGANVIKIAGNFMIMASMEMMAEAFTLAEKNGLTAERRFPSFLARRFSTLLSFKIMASSLPVSNTNP
jgi:3-hydroxyisobutyrate dehydrogenase-like beta-hydroxyacid dehydrogenase